MWLYHIAKITNYVLLCCHNIYIYIYNVLLYTVDGLAIATRLAKRISTVTKQMKKLLFAFNDGLPTEYQMPWEAAVNIHRYSYKASVQPTASIPLEVKHEAI